MNRYQTAACRLFRGATWTLLALSGAIAGAAPIVTTNIVTFAANDIVSNPVTGVLYASTSAGLTAINPVTGTVGSSYAVAGAPSTIVITSDGSYIYAVANGGNTVDRFNLQTYATDLTFTMPGIGTQYAQDVKNIYSIPGQPGSVLIARYYPGYSPPAGGTYVYQNGVALPDSVGTGLGVGGPDIIAIDETGTHAFGYQNSVSSWSYWAMSLGSNGLDGATGYASGFLSGYNIGRIAVASGKLFDDQGQIYGLVSGANLGSFAGAGNFCLDAADNMFYSVTSNSSSETLCAYNLTTLNLVGSANIAGVSGSTSNLTRFGGSGLAFTTATQVVAVSTLLVPNAWNSTTGGTWTDGTRWATGAVPHLTDDMANLGGSITQASTITVSSPVTVGSITFNNSNSYTVSGSAALTMQSSSGTAVLQEVQGSHTISAPLVLATFTLANLNQPSATLTLGGAVSGTGGLSCGGSGTVVLSHANSYTGGTTVSSGTLNLAHPLAVPNSTINVGLSGALSFAAGNTAPILGGLAGAGNVALATAASEPAMLNVGNNSQSTTYTGILSGAGGLTKVGSGTLALEASQNYSGPTAVMNGTLQLGVPSSPLSNLVARYTFANGSATDVTGNGNNGTLVGNPTFVAGVGGQAAIQLNGSQYVSVPYASDLALSSFSVSVWVDSTSNSDLVVLKNFGGTDWPFDIQINGNGHALHGDIGIGNSWLSTNVDANIPGASGATSSYPTNAWHMITYTVTNNGATKNATYQIYYDGQPTNIGVGNNGVCPGVGAPSFLSPGYTMRIGSNESNGLIGMISDFDIFSTALNSNQVASLYSFESQPSQQPTPILPTSTPLTVAANATLDLSGGSQQIASLSDYAPGNGGSIINSNSAASVLTLSPTGGSTTFSGRILSGGSNGTISLVMSGSGTQVLAGSNGYTGGTTVKSGRLAVDGSLASPVSVSGGTLAGVGTLTSVTVYAGGTLAPGDPRGLLHLSGNLTLASGAVMDYDLDGVSTDDEVSMPSGTLTFSGQQFSNFGFTWTTGFGPGTYTLVNAESITGLGSNLSGSIDGLPASLSVQNNDLMLTVVPEPGTLILLGVGAFCVASHGLRRRKKITEITNTRGS